MKRIMLLIMSLLLCAGTAQATILAPDGVDVDFYNWTGIECTPAVVLCENLSVYDARGDQGGKKVETLRYSGRTIPVIESWDGYALIYYSDGSKTGWVHSEYLLMDPAWYICDQGTPVYAYPETTAPRVGYLATGTEAPIITEYSDGRKEWVCVSLRGASGWIRKTAKDTEAQNRFHPEMLDDITSVLLTYKGEALSASAPGNADMMAALSALLTSATDMGGAYAGCPFDATLEVRLADGRDFTLQLATDSCCIYRVDGRDYQYALDQVSWEGSLDNTVLLNVFDMNSWEDMFLPANG